MLTSDGNIRASDFLKITISVCFSMSTMICLGDHGLKSFYPADVAEVEDFIDAGGLSPSWWTLGEEGAEDSGVDISSISA